MRSGKVYQITRWGLRDEVGIIPYCSGNEDYPALTDAQLQEILRENGRHISVADDRPITLEEYWDLLDQAKAAGKNTVRVDLIWRRWFARNNRPAPPPIKIEEVF